MLNWILFTALHAQTLCRHKVFIPTYPAEAGEKSMCSGRLILMDLSNGRDEDHWYCGRMQIARGPCFELPAKEVVDPPK